MSIRETGDLSVIRQWRKFPEPLIDKRLKDICKLKKVAQSEKIPKI